MVRLTEAEYNELRARAGEVGLSIQRLLVEAVLVEQRRPGPLRQVRNRERERAKFVTFMAVRRMLANAGNNLNQLTRWSHASEELHPDIDAAIVAVVEAADRVALAVEDLDYDEAGDDLDDEAVAGE